MTTELEKQFFDTFGINLIIPGNPLFCEAHCKDNCNCENCSFAEYPKLTNLKFLELIRLWNSDITGNYKTIDEFKNFLLKLFIENCTKFDIEQVRTLFEDR